LRDHLAAHPDLRRLRHREQPGASNLPEPRTKATPEQVEAARVWSGDDQSVREISDDQLAAAERLRLLDDRARARIEAEADRRDLDDLLGRIAPGGTLADDLTGFSDTELARAFGHLDDGDALRVMTEMNRRDLAARLPGVSPDLVGLSDHDLAARARDADPNTLALLAAEANRRDLLARLFPGGQLLGDLAGLSDDELAWAMQYATNDDSGSPRRWTAVTPSTSPSRPIPATPSPTCSLTATPSPRPWPPRPTRKSGGASPPSTKRAGATPTSGRRSPDARPVPCTTSSCIASTSPPKTTATAIYSTRRPRPPASTPQPCFPGPRASRTRERASDELKEWWQEHGRLTQAEFIEQVTGKSQRWAAGARKNESDQQSKR
jgi:hypothetical protein